MSALTLVLLAAGAVALAALAAAVAVGVLGRVREHESRLARMEHVAMTDEVTGLPNRRFWDEQLPRELARAERHQFPLFVAMLDIDRFKDFNDKRGHQSGDRLLKAAAGSWRAALRDYDILARYGGDEFCLVLESCTAADAQHILARVRVATPNAETCSVGIAEWNRLEAPGALVARADAALYAAKGAGRDRLAWAPPPGKPGIDLRADRRSARACPSAAPQAEMKTDGGSGGSRTGSGPRASTASPEPLSGGFGLPR